MKRISHTATHTHNHIYRKGRLIGSIYTHSLNLYYTHTLIEGKFSVWNESFWEWRETRTTTQKKPFFFWIDWLNWMNITQRKSSQSSFYSFNGKTMRLNRNNGNNDEEKKTFPFRCVRPKQRTTQKVFSLHFVCTISFQCVLNNMHNFSFG